MTKELTPEEKADFDVEQEGGLTPEQMAKNLENQKNIEPVPEPISEETITETETSPTATEDVLENIVDLDEPVAPSSGSIKLDSDIPKPDEGDIIDLDNILDKADHTYNLEQEDIEAAPSAAQDMQDNLDQQISGAAPTNPEKAAFEKEAQINKDKQNLKEGGKDMSHVRTFHKDVSALRDTGNTAITSRMLREARRGENEDKEDVSMQNQIKTMSILGVVFIVITLGIIVYMTQFNKPTTTALESVDNISSLIPADVQIPIDVTGAYHFKIKSTLAEHIAEQTEFKKLAHFYFGTATRNGGRLLTSHDFFQALNVKVPLSLTSVIGDEFMMGTYTIQEPYPFLILPVNSFPKAQDAMTQWEGNMLRDLKDVFALPSESVQPEAFEGNFVDDIIANQHVRLLYTPIIETLEETFIVIDQPEEGEIIENDEVIVDEEVVTEEVLEDETILVEEVEEGLIDTELIEDEPIVELPPQTLTQVQRIIAGDDLTLVYTFINEQTILITTNPIIIPEIVKRYSNRQIFLR